MAATFPGFGAAAALAVVPEPGERVLAALPAGPAMTGAIWSIME